MNASETVYYTGKTPGVNVSVIFRGPTGEVLLGLRRSGQFAGCWGLPGGKVDLGETLLQAAQREAREETSLEADCLNLVSVNDIITESAHFVNVVFEAVNHRGTPRETEPQEIGDWTWFPLDSLPTPLYHNAASALSKFREGRLY